MIEDEPPALGEVGSGTPEWSRGAFVGLGPQELRAWAATQPFKQLVFDQVGALVVSTAWNGFTVPEDDQGRPLPYETMVLVAEGLEVLCRARFATEQEARAAHPVALRKAVRAARFR